MRVHPVLRSAAIAVLVASLTPVLLVAQETPVNSVPTAEDLARPGDLWIETRSVAAQDGTEVTADFGRLVVPENRARTDSNPIQIAFVRLRGSAQTGRAPVVYLAGGPGDASTWQASDAGALQRWVPMLADGDVVLLDQRGAGESSPRLRWRVPGMPAFDAFADAGVMRDLAIEMATSARQALVDAGHDLDGYTTVENARDIDDLRQVLGYERVSLLGFSYGTHLAIAYAREFGDRLEAMALNGVEGPDQTLKLPIHMDTQFRKISLLVASDPEIGPVIPDLVALLQRVQQRLEDEPMVVQLENPESGQRFDVAVGRHFLDFIIRRDIGDARDIPVFPRLLYSIDQGDPSVLRWFVQRRAGIVVAINGLTVMDVASGATPARLAMIAEQSDRSLFRGAANFPMPVWNEAWQAPDLGDSFRSPLVSDARTLLLSGTLDWNTPPFQAEQLRWGLTDATHIIVDNAGHEQVLPHPDVWAAVAAFFRGDDVSDVRASLPPLTWVPLEGYDPERWHPSVPRE